MPESVFREWQAFEKYVEPFEDRRMDLRIGLLACALASGFSKVDPQSFSLSGFGRDDESDPEAWEDPRLMKVKMDQAAVYARLAEERQTHDSHIGHHVDPGLVGQERR